MRARSRCGGVRLALVVVALMVLSAGSRRSFSSSGGLNWGLVAVAEFDLVVWIVGLELFPARAPQPVPSLLSRRGR